MAHRHTDTLAMIVVFFIAMLLLPLQIFVNDSFLSFLIALVAGFMVPIQAHFLIKLSKVNKGKNK